MDEAPQRAALIMKEGPPKRLASQSPTVR